MVTNRTGVDFSIRCLTVPTELNLYRAFKLNVTFISNHNCQSNTIKLCTLKIINMQNKWMYFFVDNRQWTKYNFKNK